MDGQPPSPGWSPTIQNLPEGRVLPGVLRDTSIWEVYFFGPKSILFLLVDFGRWVTILGMVGDHPGDGG